MILEEHHNIEEARLYFRFLKNIQDALFKKIKYLGIDGTAQNQIHSRIFKRLLKDFPVSLKIRKVKTLIRF